MSDTKVFLQNVHHAFAQTDGTYKWPAGLVGDLLRQAHRDVTGLERECAELRKKLEWQPIETAPKDGEPILLYSPDDGAHQGRWVDDRYDTGWCINGLFSNCWSHWKRQEPPL